MEPEENPFSYVIDQDALSPEEREEYLKFWASRTPNERLAEVFRLNRIKWGDEVFDRGMDKSKLEVVDMKTGKILEVIYTSKNK